MSIPTHEPSRYHAAVTRLLNDLDASWQIPDASEPRAVLTDTISQMLMRCTDNYDFPIAEDDVDTEMIKHMLLCTGQHPAGQVETTWGVFPSYALAMQYHPPEGGTVRLVVGGTVLIELDHCAAPSQPPRVTC